MNIVKTAAFAAIIFWSLGSVAQNAQGIPNPADNFVITAKKSTVCLIQNSASLQMDQNITLNTKIENGETVATELIDAGKNSGTFGDGGVNYAISGTPDGVDILWGVQGVPTIVQFNNSSNWIFYLETPLTAAEAAKVMGEEMEAGSHCYSAAQTVSEAL